MALFTADGWLFFMRWFHFLAGITWIGMLYYFNFVQTPFFATAEPPVRMGMIVGSLVGRALWWFRWGRLSRAPRGRSSRRASCTRGTLPATRPSEAPRSCRRCRSSRRRSPTSPPTSRTDAARMGPSPAGPRKACRRR